MDREGSRVLGVSRDRDLGHAWYPKLKSSCSMHIMPVLSDGGSGQGGASAFKTETLEKGSIAFTF